jgi:DNA-binding winged helix-turn-helix (wHTH) protein
MVILAWDDCELDMTAYELRRGGERCHVEPQVFDLLAYLVHNRGRLVSKDEVIEHIWPERYVTEAALSSRLMAARKAIGDSGEAQRRILTVKGRGFRFVGEVREVARPANPVKVAEEQPPAGAREPAATATRFVRTTDGVSIAFATYGGGPGIPILFLSTPLESHLSLRLSLPWERLGGWSQQLCEDRLLVMFDPRCAGLSDRGVEDVGMEARLRDIDAVVNELRLQRFAVYAEGVTSLVALTYAARHPGSVALLILLGPITRSEQFWLSDPRLEALHGLATTYWRLFTDTWSRLGLGWDHARPSVWADQEPGRTSGADATEFARYLRRCQAQGDWLRSVEARLDLDVEALLPQIRSKVVFLVPEDWAPAFLETARSLAARFADARLVFFGWWRQMDATVAALREFDAEQGRPSSG